MNLRTITCWALYHPADKEIVAVRRFKHQLESIHHPAGTIVVKLTGHYIPRDAASNESKEKI